MQLPQKRTLWIVFVVVLVAAFLAIAVAFVRLNSRLSDEIVSAPWRNPIEIVNVARGPGAAPIVRVYGNDWRVTQPVRLTDLPPHVPRAFMAAEDVRFERHIGIDPIGIARAIFANVRGHRVAQGGSTITQQLVKQKLFSNARTFRRKIPEALLAIVLTARMSKNDVMEGYLNDVYLGQFGGAAIYGVDEAARIYFSKAPGSLTVDEAALIAGIIRAPNRDNPIAAADQAVARRNDILGTMRDQKWIDDTTFDQATHRPLRLHPGTLPDTPFGHYLSAMRTEIAGLTSTQVPNSGIRIVCGLEPSMQQAAEETARDGTNAMRRQYPWLRSRTDLQMAIVAADPRSGIVRALVGSRDFRTDSYDRTRRMHRQPGSAIKPFVYAAALESRKFTTTSVLQDEPLQIKLDRRHVWEPHDYDDRFRGPVPLRIALEQSLNVPTVRLAQDVGLNAVVGELKKFGLDEDFKPIPSLPLGVNEVTLRELTSAYTAFPALGQRMPLHLIDTITDRRGKTIYKFDAKPERACDPAVAWLVYDILRGVVKRGTASRLSDAGLDFVAGKTGTTSDYRDAWFMGFTADLVAGLWIGCDGGSPLRLSAGEAAVPMWARFAEQIHLNRLQLPPPPGLSFRNVDPNNGTLWERGCEGPVPEVFLSGTEPQTTCNGDRVGHRSLLARLRGNPEPAEISDAQSQSESNGQPTPESPDEIVPGGTGSVPQIGDDGEDAKPSKHHHEHKHHARHHHRGGLSVPALLRRIFG